MWMGIDPGGLPGSKKSGAIAVLRRNPFERTFEIETIKLSETEDDVWDFVHDHRTCDFAILERAQTRPGQAAGGVLKFGDSYGFCRGILAAAKIPRDRVTATQWQTYLKCRSGGDKNVTKAKAQQLFPRVTMTHAIADAILIAEYCRRIRADQGIAESIRPEKSAQPVA